MPKTYRIGIAGAGFAGSFHLENFPECGIEVAGVTSARAESREAFAERHGLRAYTSVAEMLPDIDILDICTPPSSHGEYILAAAGAGKHIIVEKPLTGFFGSPKEFTKGQMLEGVLAECGRLRDAVLRAGVGLGYAENMVYAPSVQKEREVVERTRAQILRLAGEESHNGSHSPVYGIWSVQGGGALIAKGCHPLGAILYLRRKEGLARTGQPIRPAAVSARTHAITRLPGFEDRGFIRSDYQDTEDYSVMHNVFDDGMVADVTASDIVLGGLYDFIEVFANNHRARCRISPANMLDVYNPKHEQFQDLYLIEKISSNEGWVPASPEEGWSLGYANEFRNFIGAIREGKPPESDLDLAIDITLTLYAAYVSADDKGREVKIPSLG